MKSRTRVVLETMAQMLVAITMQMIGPLNQKPGQIKEMLSTMPEDHFNLLTTTTTEDSLLLSLTVGITLASLSFLKIQSKSLMMDTLYLQHPYGST